MSDRLSDFPVTFHNRQYAPLMVGGMGVNSSNDTLALAVEKLGGIAHLSDAMLMTQEKPTLKVCKNCGKVYYNTHAKSVFCGT